MTLIDIINDHKEDPVTLREHLRVIITIKEKVLSYYMDVTDAYHVNLRNISVNCKDWANLFKSFTYLFTSYESVILRKLVDKFRMDLGVQKVNNVRGSAFVKALYELYIENQAKEREISNIKQNMDHSKNDTMSHTRTNNSIVSGNTRDFQDMVRDERADLLSDMLTMGRGAHRENEKGSKVVSLVEQNPQDAKSMTNDALLKNLEQLDGVIYKEGREKRSKQNLLDSLMSTLNTNSKDYDSLLDNIHEMQGVYKKMLIFAQENCPEVLKECKKPKFDEIEQFEKNRNFYKKALNSGMLK